MKRFFIVAVALFVVLSMVSFAVAEDRLKLSGSYRTRVWSRSDWDFNDNADDQTAFIDSRFRIGGAIQAAEGVTANFRFDVGEGTWGLNYDTVGRSGRPDAAGVADEEFQVDRVFGQIDRELFRFRFGQQYVSMGHAVVLDNNLVGAWLRLHLPVQIDVLYSKDTENGAVTDESSLGTEDRDLYGLQGVYVTDQFAIGAFYAWFDDKSAADNSPNVFGLHGRLALGSIVLRAELDIFGGDFGAADYVGNQFFIDAEWTVNDKFSISGGFYYATAEDANNTGGEIQIDALVGTAGDWWSMWPQTHGIPGLLQASYATVPGSVMDPDGDESGGVSFGIWGEYKVIDPLTLSAGFIYMTPQDDDPAITDFDKASVINLGFHYAVMEGVRLAGAYSYTSLDRTGAAPDDPRQTLLGILQVSF